MKIPTGDFGKHSGECEQFLPLSSRPHPSRRQLPDHLKSNLRWTQRTHHRVSN